MAWKDAQLKLLRDGGKKQCGFHHGEGTADAQAGPAAEGEIGELGQALLEFLRPALRMEALGLVKIARVAVHNPLAHDDARPPRHRVPANLVTLRRDASNDISGRVQAQRFLDDHFGIRQARQVRDGR